MRIYDDFIEACVRANPSSTVPEMFSRWAAIGAVSAALGRKVWYDAGEFKIRPNTYIALIADPGRGKSLSLILPFYKVLYPITLSPGEKLENSDNQQRIEALEVKDSPIYVLEDRITPEEIIIQLSRAKFMDPQVSTPNDTQVSSHITLITSEFGTLMARDSKYLPIFLTDLWDGSKPVQGDRSKTSGKYIVRNASLGWVACATPEQFVTHMPGNARNQGLLSRMLIIYYDGPPRKEDIHYGGVSENIIENLQHDLADIAKLRGPMVFDDAIIDRVRAEVQAGLLPRPSDPNLREYLERRFPHIMKLAMIVSAARRTNGIIKGEDWDTAKRYLFEAEAQMPKALLRFGMGNAGQLATDMQEFVRRVLTSAKKSGISITLFRSELLRRVNNAGEVDHVLKAMTDAGLIKITDNLVSLG